MLLINCDMIIVRVGEGSVWDYIVQVHCMQNVQGNCEMRETCSSFMI